MASLKYQYDLSGEDTGGGGDEPQPGVYSGKIVSITHRDKKSNGDPTNDLEVVLDIGSTYVRLWTYIGFADNQRWKMAEFLDAVGLPRKGTLTEAILKKQEGKRVKVKVRGDNNMDGDYRGSVKNLFPFTEGDDDGDADAPAAGEADFSAMTDDDLKAELAERGIKLDGRFTSAKAVAALEAAAEDALQAAAEPEADAEDEFDITEFDGFGDFAEWSESDLKDYVKEAEIAMPKGKATEAKLRDAIIEHIKALVADDGDGDGDGDADGADASDDLDTWTDSDLEEEIGSRNEQGASIEITGRKTRQKLIDALREDNKNASNPF